MTFILLMARFVLLIAISQAPLAIIPGATWEWQVLLSLALVVLFEIVAPSRRVFDR